MEESVIKLLEQLDLILIGKKDKTKKIVATLLVGGNILLEDVPGVGKTIVSKSLSKMIYKDDGQLIKFSRIQGTPDLLPYDITGVDVYDPEKKDFVFKPGPVFTDILLADELNRTTPKVQSALLQAMAEKQVTIGIKTYQLPEIFFVIATQNPVESEGTYPLPAAQLDRFSCCLSIGYPDLENEINIFQLGKSEDRFSILKPVISEKEILEIRKKIKEIEVNEKIHIAIAKICQRTRETKDIRLGLSTRSGLMMIDMLKANAYLNKRDFVTDQDLIDLAEDVWAHRLMVINPQIKPKELISRITREEVRKIIRKF
ncbi:MAG TPA: AAA family ATPase [Spirochaetota bacterium]|nr:AAA family ATPase [Spirochaetota bacterium]HOL57647.1 AAA family ATPase [Spirochaetota bacterium]HPP05201.1 AAA family ATPase [Spirochaetota bacterium]